MYNVLFEWVWDSEWETWIKCKFEIGNYIWEEL